MSTHLDPCGRLIGRACALVGVATALAFALVPLAGAHARPQLVRVTITDTACRTSPGEIGFGNAHFMVTNRGRTRHGFSIAGKRTGWLKPRGGKALVDIDFLRPGSYRFSCTTPGRPSLPGRFSIANRPADTDGQEVTLTKVADYAMTTFIVAPPADRERLVAGQLSGRINLIKDGAPQPEPFLDLTEIAYMNGEQGLLGLAFAPDYAQSGLLYVVYNDVSGALQLDEFRRADMSVDRADVTTRRRVLRIEKPGGGHNGGWLQFGPDGYLYLTIGDGGEAGPSAVVGATGQTLDDLFASIIRIDPRQQPDGAPYRIPTQNPYVGREGARGELFAIGVRNPWRGWIDAPSNTLWFGDVGDQLREEVNRVRLDEAGANFGWPCREGSVVDATSSYASCASSTPPLYEYAHTDQRCSVTGGIVMRDPRLSGFDGAYLFGDLCTGEIWRLWEAAGEITVLPLGVSVPNVIAFGMDAANRAYISSAAGPIFRIDPKQ